jgi:hypothetical protein
VHHVRERSKEEELEEEIARVCGHVRSDRARLSQTGKTQSKEKNHAMVVAVLQREKLI